MTRKFSVLMVDDEPPLRKGVVGHQKTHFSQSFAGVEGASDIIRAEGAVIRQSSASKGN